LVRGYKLEVIEDAGKSVYTGEFGRIGAYDRQRA